MSIELPGRLESSFEHAGIPTVHAGSGQVPLCACVSCVCRVFVAALPSVRLFIFVIRMLREKSGSSTLVDTEGHDRLYLPLYVLLRSCLWLDYSWTLSYHQNVVVTFTATPTLWHIHRGRCRQYNSPRAASPSACPPTPHDLRASTVCICTRRGAPPRAPRQWTARRSGPLW